MPTPTGTKSAGAPQTFFLNFSPDPQVNEIAARENATSTKNISEMQETLKKIVQNSKILESRTWLKKSRRIW
jgi:N-acetylmuramoyl-L-alanine amidase